MYLQAVPSQVRSAHDKIVSTLIATSTPNPAPEGLIGPLLASEFKSAIRKLLINGGHSRIRTYDFHRVKVGSNQTAAHSKGVISRYSR